MSMGGAQPKVSARLSPSRGTFELVDIGGHYILKPGHPVYAELPANEDLSMRMAAAAGIETPLHGLVFARDATLCYVVRRFDRVGATGKRAVEDVGQLLGVSREAKYAASMEDVASVLDQYATIPVLDHERLLRRTLVAFLLGDEDLHIRNLSLLTGEAVIRLSPAYDIVNTTLAQGGADDELALPLGGRKAGFERGHFTDYFGRDVLGLRQAVVEQVVGDIRAAQPAWDDLLVRSFLSEGARQSYADLLSRRRRRLGL
ncbi:MAG: HipA domain-containing protein [Bacteroidota bacterium]